MLWLEEVRNEHRTLVVVGLVALVALAGCLGFGGEEEADGESIGEQSIDIQPTEATQALWEEGYRDPYLDTQPTGEVHEFDFYADEYATVNPYGNLTLGAFAFSTSEEEPGQVPGPEIRVTQGDRVRVTLHDPENMRMLPGHTMHWHGIDIPWRSDGVPFVTQDVTPAQETGTYTYEFVAKQAGTYWYHCVVDFPTHVDAGMFGPLIVEPQDPEQDLPFDREETLMFHEADSQYLAWDDWAQNENADPDPERISSNPIDAVDSVERQARSATDIGGIIAEDITGVETWAEGPRDYYPLGSLRYQPSYDTFMINGKSYPDTQPLEISEGETLRLRWINAGQLHKSIHLHGHHVLVTHNDGYPLEDPHWEDTVHLAPGERKDVYVQGTNPGIWKLHDHSGASGMGSTNANDYAFPGGQITAMVYEGFEPPEGLPVGDAHENTAGDYAVHAHSHGNR